ncbi:MAG: hypothetical protein ACI906_003821 [Candidatus Latescibacterota bacterium]|jgi:hypothetical protein
MNSEEKRARVLLFIYGELSAQEEREFHSELAADAELKMLLEEEQRFDALYPSSQPSPAQAPLVDEGRLLLRAALRREQRRFRWSSLWDSPRWGLWGRPAFALCFGVLLGWGIVAEGPREEESPISMGDVVDLRVLGYDEASGRTELGVRVLTERRLEGHVGDEAVQMLLVSALRSSGRDADRLQAVNWLEPKSDRLEIRRALIDALREDENPGVRVKAAEVLESMATEKDVRQAFRHVLKEDANMGVRVAAIAAIAAFRDSATLDLMKSLTVQDDNDYIRLEARRVLEMARAETAQSL